MKEDVKCIVRSGLLLAIAIVFQTIGRNIPQINQFIVGPAINTILLIGTFTCGIWWGVAIGVLTPITAWVLGQLPQPMAPFIPFIALGNAIYVVTFGVLSYYKKWGQIFGYLLGSVLKYLFLYFSALKLIYLFKISIPEKVASKLVVMMGIPQLITALIGGGIAIIIIKMLLKRNIKLED
ncbi:ECF transporter S component [Caloramator sp. E03]|uniref:ECF transporter S component n=1 Tax=Caloramator sp. E03 TaxID=2576307 RepID=UPI001110DD4A|nr:ECF transporter S component [Caloramator sp. E03]QCX33372.1 ECF transporter S component [Caloramator sp. E03]